MVNEDKRTLEEKLLDGIDSLVSYNGLGETVERWLALEPDGWGQSIACPGNYTMTDAEVYRASWACEQLQAIWMIAVECYGDWGTSPRFGWIDDIDGFRWFVNRILQSYRRGKEMEVEINGHDQMDPGK